MVLINGRNISDYTHDDVVMLIKASCENQSAELILLVRPNGKELYIHGHFIHPALLDPQFRLAQGGAGGTFKGVVRDYLE